LLLGLAPILLHLSLALLVLLELGGPKLEVQEAQAISVVAGH
jgi:hypothetical protein